MADLDPELVDNYRELHQTTGESYDSIATRVETGDPATAAKLRAEFGHSRSAAPTARAAAPTETADAKPVPKKAPAKTAASKKAPAKTAASKKA